MFYQPELIVYLWMLPVLFMIVLPVLWTITRMLYQAVDRSWLKDVRGFAEIGEYGVVEQPGQERRKSPRIRVDGSKVAVAQQINCCRTSAANISHHGIFFSDIPQKMFMELDKLKVVFRTRERDYSMFVQPKWIKRGENGHMLGAEIINTPPGWECFVNGLCGPAVVEAI